MLNAREPFPIAAAAEHRLERRRFLRAAAAAAVCGAAGEWIAGLIGSSAPPALPVRLDATDVLAVGAARAIDTGGGEEALLVRLDATTLVGFARRCPHLGCPVLWAAERRRFECPCHHAAFDARTGQVLFGPPRRGLQPVMIQTA